MVSLGTNIIGYWILGAFLGIVLTLVNSFSCLLLVISCQLTVCRHYDDPEPFDVNGGRHGDDVESYRQHPSSEPQLRRVQSRSQLETQKLTDDVLVSSHY